jgi:hypothetical protein
VSYICSVRPSLSSRAVSVTTRLVYLKALAGTGTPYYLIQRRNFYGPLEPG